MQSLSKYNTGIKYLLCAIDLFSKYVWAVLLTDKRGFIIINTFQKIISKERKLNKIGVDQSDEFYSKYFKTFLKIKNIEMYSTYREGKSDFPKRLIRLLKNKNFKDMTAVSKNVYFDVLDDIVDKYNNTGYRTIKKKPISLHLVLMVITSKYQNTKSFSLKDTPKMVKQFLEVFMKKNFKKLVKKNSE